jgi:hypothetical protein
LPFVIDLLEEAHMRFAFRLVLAVVLTLALVPVGTASAQALDRKMDRLFASPNAAINSDFAFWGDHAFSGYYTGTTGGLRIFDISNPAQPDMLVDLKCNGNQNDPIVWDRNENGVADLMLLAVDRTMDSPACDAAQSFRPNPDPTQPPLRFDAKPDGWEGVRVFTMSDNPANPFQTITQVDSQYTDCGAHTITAWTGHAHETVDPSLIVYVSSYPLRPGPTCGQTTPGVTTPPHQNTSNPFDDDKVVNDPLHRQIQVLRVPLNNPAATTEIAAPEIVYPGDPDGRIEWCERGRAFGFCTPGAFEPAAVACHDIVTHMQHNIAGAACAEQGQIWDIDPETGIPDTENPMIVGDDVVSSGGPGGPGGPGIDFFMPGAVDFFHSVMFNNDGTVVNWVDESFGAGCPTMSTYESRPWNPAGGRHETGRMFFSDMDANFLSEFNVGDLRPDSQLDPNGNELEYCSSHMGMTVAGIKRDILVNAWYTGGTNVIDFSNPRRLREIAFYDPKSLTGHWSSYPYTGPLFRRGGGVPVYVSDGVEDPPNAQGMEVYRAKIPTPSRRNLMDHMNPQTMDHMVDGGGGNGGGGDDDDDDDDDDRGDDDDDDDDDRGGRGRDRRGR